jgi:fructose-1-phosphate kinase PfkB-like protein
VDGKGQLLREAMQAGVEWAKANLAEAEETMQKKGASRCLEAMRNLSCGRSCLSITQGSRGLVLQAGKQRFPGRAPKIHLLDATGSGDVASAALIYGIRKGWEIEKVAGFAVWAGSEKAARRDAVVRRLKG